MLASHIARHSTDKACLVTSLTSDERCLNVDWADGHRSQFHLIWLRDNCSCDECGDHSGGHRFFELNLLPCSFQNKASLVDGMVEIEWLEDGHSTVFDPAWLRAHCYDSGERTRRRHQPVTWMARLQASCQRWTIAS